MSIYRKSIDRVFDDIKVHPTQVAGDSTTQSAPMMSEAQLRAEKAREESERSKRTKGEPSNAVLSRTMAWAAELPPEIQPPELIRLFPRIANQLAADWMEPDATRQYFDQLLESNRASRAGFPGSVESELLALRRYYSTLHPESLERGPAWQDVRKR